MKTEFLTFSKFPYTKVFLLLSLSLFCSISTMAQDYVFPTDSATWHNLFQTFYEDGSGRISNQKLTHYKVDGDTIINGQTCYKVYASDGSAATFKFTYHIDGEKIYSDSILMYDFSLSVGDTFFAPNGGEFIVLRIDSITLHDGKHKRLSLSQDVQFIRGIGSPQGLFAFLGPNVSSFYEELMCFSHKEVSLYPSYSDTTCYELTNTLSIVQRTVLDISIYPNPTVGQLIISSSLEIEKINIYDSQGRLLQSFFIDHIGPLEMNINGISGVYFIEALANDGSVSRTRVIKL